MSSTYSRVSAASPSGSNEPGCEPSRSVNRTKESVPSLQSTGRKSPAFPMWKRYAELKSGNEWTLFAADSRVRTCLSLDDVPGLQASAADYGLTTPVSLASYDPVSSSWRTCQGCLFEAWEQFSATWPRSGTTRNGTAYRLRPLAPRTYELASGFLPTPVASETKRTTPYAQGGQSLSFVLGGRPSQALIEWMMGLPDGWLTLLAMPSSRKYRKSSGAR
jgi:hypothetical protein